MLKNFAVLSLVASMSFSIVGCGGDGTIPSFDNKSLIDKALKDNKITLRPTEITALNDAISDGNNISDIKAALKAKGIVVTDDIETIITSALKNKVDDIVEKSDKSVHFVYFNNYMDSFDNEKYVERSDTVVTDGDYNRIHRLIVGSQTSKDNIHNDDSIYLAPDFEYVLSIGSTSSINELKKSHSVLSNTGFTRVYTGSGTAKKLTETISFTFADISNVMVNDAKYSTILDDDFADNSTAKFPVGSQCEYESNVKSSFPYFELNEKYSGKVDKIDTIEKWVTARKGKDVKKIKVGANNEYTVAYVDGKYDVYGYAVVDYKGELYGASHYNKDSTNTSTDNNGKLECEKFNKIAADYIEKLFIEKHK